MKEDAFSDADLDGYCNFREYLSGSHPNDLEDIPPIFADGTDDGEVDDIDIRLFSEDFGRVEN